MVDTIEDIISPLRDWNTGTKADLPPAPKKEELPKEEAIDRGAFNYGHVKEKVHEYFEHAEFPSSGDNSSTYDFEDKESTFKLICSEII
jgi:hypothetical protein